MQKETERTLLRKQGVFSHLPFLVLNYLTFEEIYSIAFEAFGKINRQLKLYNGSKNFVHQEFLELQKLAI